MNTTTFIIILFLFILLIILTIILLKKRKTEHWGGWRGWGWRGRGWGGWGGWGWRRIGPRWERWYWKDTDCNRNCYIRHGCDAPCDNDPNSDDCKNCTARCFNECT